jgi:aromatic ring-opening dioxygenase catalytic subunit (LigB family)
MRSSFQAEDRMPVVFVPHGGGPWPFIENAFGDPDELEELATYLRSLRTFPQTPPRAILMISAHWEEQVPTVMTAERPPMLYDYYGFPPEAYRINWPAPGHPELADRVRALLEDAGLKTASDSNRGFDHGAFVPLKLAYPEADMPTVQLSLKRGLDPNEHIAIGRALQPLRDERVFIVGSGMTFHNLRAFTPQAAPYAEAFDRWLRETMMLDEPDRNERLLRWFEAPAARIAQPREEHLLPLMVVAGAAGSDRPRVAYNGTIMNLRLSGYEFPDRQVG